jgi:predicted nucleotidyltransferase
MVALERIQEFCDQIAAEFHPERIVLFGSYAYGTPRADSDVDLLVILTFEGRRTAKSVEMLKRVEPTFPVDLLVRTPEEVRQRLAWNDFFLREVMERGRTLYAATDGRVDGKGRRRLRDRPARNAGAKSPEL